jgi:hypothetical protein
LFPFQFREVGIFLADREAKAAKESADRQGDSREQMLYLTLRGQDGGNTR